MNAFYWYPPAETRIPLQAVRIALAGSPGSAEQTLRKATGSTYCCFGPSGRSLLGALLQSLSQKSTGQRNEILIPGYTCYSVAAAAVKAGLKIRFYDLDPQSLAPDSHSLKSNCRRQTLAVISQHLFGIPIDLGDFEALAADRGVYHIEDAAQAQGGRMQGKPLGTTGDFGLFSFGRGKPLPLGGGGSLISSRFDPTAMIPPYRTRPQWDLLALSILTQLAARPSLYGLAETLPLGLGETIFDPHFESGPVPLSLHRLLQPMMGHLEELNAHRRAIAAIYQNRIAARCLITVPENSEPVFHRFPVMARMGRLPLELRRLGVRRLYPNALHREPRIAMHAAGPSQQLPGVTDLARRLVTLPTHHLIDGAVAATIARKLNRWIAPEPDDLAATVEKRHERRKDKANSDE